MGEKEPVVHAFEVGVANAHDLAIWIDAHRSRTIPVFVMAIGYRPAPVLTSYRPASVITSGQRWKPESLKALWYVEPLYSATSLKSKTAVVLGRKGQQQKEHWKSCQISDIL